MGCRKKALSGGCLRSNPTLHHSPSVCLCFCFCCWYEKEKENCDACELGSVKLLPCHTNPKRYQLAPPDNCGAISSTSILPYQPSPFKLQPNPKIKTYTCSHNNYHNNMWKNIDLAIPNTSIQLAMPSPN